MLAKYYKSDNVMKPLWQ